MGTFTLTADFRDAVYEADNTKQLVIYPNTQVVGDNGEIFDEATVTIADGVLSVDLPANDCNPGDFGFIVRRPQSQASITKRWQVPAQDPGTSVDLSQFTATTPLPTPPETAVASVAGIAGVVGAEQLAAALAGTTALASAIAGTAIVPSGLAKGAGIDPTGATDSTAGLQAAINALPTGGMLYIPNGTYKLTDALVINKTCSIIGESSQGNWPGLGAGGSFDVPLGNPPLRGVVLNQTAAGKNGLTITASGNAVHLENLGILFTGASVRWVNTGHGIAAVPTATVTNGHGTAPDHGTIDSRWRNLNVFGHDGDHYGFKMVNTMLSTLENIRSWGGGGLEVLCNSVSGNYGNLVVIHPYINLFCEGTAHGYHFDGSAASGGYGLLNLITMIRPQCNGEDLTAIFPTSTAPNPANQYLIRAGETNAIDRLSIIGPDFESPISMPVELGEGRGHHIDVSGTPELAGTPTLTKKPNLGASVATLNASASDNAGFISVTAAAGLSTAYQSILTVMWEHRDSGNYDDIVLITPKNGNAPVAGAYVEMIAGGFELRVSMNLVSGEKYEWYYAVVTGHVLNT